MERTPYRVYLTWMEHFFGDKPKMQVVPPAADDPDMLKMAKSVLAARAGPNVTHRTIKRSELK